MRPLEAEEFEKVTSLVIPVTGFPYPNLDRIIAKIVSNINKRRNIRRIISQTS